MAHDHDNGHGQGGHSHGPATDADRGWLGLALGLIAGFMVVEVLVGALAHSLALLSDAAHMLTDAGSIILALVALRLAARPPKDGYTYGLKRAEILSAQANGLTLLILSAWLTYEAIRRLISPPPVQGGPVLVTAIVGIAVNLLAAWSISKANRSSLNVEGAFQHILTDLYGFIATAIAGVLVLTTGFTRADAIASLVVVVLMVRAGTGLVRESGRIFLEAAPTGLDPNTVGDKLASVPTVVEVHDLHIWQITSDQPALSAHVLVEPGGDCHALRRHLEQMLHNDYHITHTTMQVDHSPQDVLSIADTAPVDPHCEQSHGPAHRRDDHAH